MSRMLFETRILPITDKMYRYAYSILSDRETAQDVVQECLEKIWKNRKKLPQIKNFDSWAMRITRNQCYDWVKVNRYSLVSDTDITRDDIIEPERIGADHDAVYKDQLSWLHKILDSLPQKQQEIYHLREIEEMTYQDIAEVLSLSLSEVKVTLHRTRQKIKTTIEKIESYGIAN